MEKLFKLFRIQCEDLVVLAEMEWNGMVFDAGGARNKARELQTKCDELVERFKNLTSCEFGNIGSGSFCSVILYGGTIEEELRIPIGVFKTGAKKGQVRYKREIVSHGFPRLVEPPKDQETAKSVKRREDGEAETPTEWGVSEPVLKKLRATGLAKKIIQTILEYRELEKLRGTYLEGWSNLIDEQHWGKDMIHGQLNQCVAQTGRIASSKPNLQNADKETKKFLISRYKNDS